MMISHRQLPLAFGHVPAVGDEDFMPANCNSEALAWIRRWPDWPGPALVLYGPRGCGKSHLAHIFARISAASRLTARALDQALEIAPDAAYVLDPALPLDNEIGLLRLYNRLKENAGHLLLVAHQPPNRWPIELPDLASRLRAAPAVAIGAPDDGLLGTLLIKLFDDRQLKVPLAVVGYLLAHMERSFDAARQVVEALDHLSLERQRPLTVPLARIALRSVEEQGTPETVFKDL